jgi:hypothetical protein
MKKQYLILLSSSLLALASCGGTSGALLPSGGTSVDQKEAIQHLSTAVGSVGSDGSFGIKLENFALAANAEVNTPIMSGYSDLMGLASIGTPTVSLATTKASLDVSGVTFSAMAQGLKSKTVNDVKASVDFGASIKANVEMANGGITQQSSVDYSGMSVGAYIDSGNFYLDLSNEKAVSLVNTLLSLFSTLRYSSSSDYSGGMSIPTIPTGKFVQNGVISASMLPLLSDSVEGDITTTMNYVSTYLTAYKDYFKSYSYSNGNYAIDFTLTKDSLKALISNTLSSVYASSSMDSTTQSAVTSYVELINKYLTINACQEVLIYNDKGPVSIAQNVDVAVNTTLGDIVGSMASSANSMFTSAQLAAVEKLSYKSSYKLSFLTGTDVKVNTPSDLASYTNPTTLETTSVTAQ